MQRPKQQAHFRPQHRKYEQITPKIPAKTPLNFRQRKLAGQSSALPANRTKPKDVNYFQMQRPTYRLESLSKQKMPLSEEQIKKSTIYRLLEQEMINLAKRQQTQIAKLQQLKKAKEKEFADVKSQQHAIKLQIWQLRNETLELKESIREQKEQTERLMDQLGITEEDLENENSQQYANQQNQNENNTQHFEHTDTE